MLRKLALTLAIAATSAFAGNDDVIRETEGFGATQQEALKNALVEAERQVHGTAAGVDRSIEETMAVIAGSNGGDTIQTTSKPVQDVYTESRGFVRSYQVLDQRMTDKGVYVRIRAVVPVFTSAVSDAGKHRYAVMPFRITTSGYALTDHGDAAAFSQRLNDALVSRLAGENGVVLVNRDFFEELGVEKAVLSADAAPEELTKLGASVGADFLLVGRVQEARTEQESGVYGSSPKTTDEIRLSWRLVEAATGKIAGAGDISFDSFRKDKNPYGTKQRDDFEAGALFAALAKNIANAALEKPEEDAGVKKPVSKGASIPLTPGSSDKPVQW